MKYRKKPVVIEAWQYNPNEEDNTVGIPRWVLTALTSGKMGPLQGSKELEIRTLEGAMRASAGDWIIKGIQGELYPCKPDIFEQTYEKVE